MKRTFLLLFSVLAFTASAQRTTITLLGDVRDYGAWPCLYYELNRNADIAIADEAGWMMPEEDESYWVEGFGPFSCDENVFFITDWASEVRPILIRRHFTLSADMVEAIQKGTVTLQTSYDENPVIYLNGTKLTSYSGWNDNSYATLTFTRERRSLLVEGDNVLAVSVMQGAGGGHIDFSQKAKVNIDGIEAVTTDDTTSALYDLQGRRLTTAKGKGIFIQNEKKLIVR